MHRSISPLLFLLWCSFLPLYGQNKLVTIRGKVTDQDQHPLEQVNVVIRGTVKGTVSNSNGEFVLPPVSGRSVIVTFSLLGYEKTERKVDTENNSFLIQILRPELRKISEVVIEKRRDKNNLVSIEPKLAAGLPTMAGGVETLIKTLPGVSNNNELSSQYSVRGGNFDENLVYVNGIEIIRPFLVKSGEQEGLSFINSDMVASVGFSSGGFDASYGDKMSSVLDITYRNPDHTGASAEIGALGASAHFEGSSSNKKFSVLTGIRYKNSAYLLGTLDKKGEYNPSFTDLQAYMNYRFNPQLSVGFLGNYSANSFQFIPKTQLTRFGTLTNPYQFLVYFDGREKDKFENSLGALLAEYAPNNRLSLKFQGSSFHSSEREAYDILGEYYLSDIDQTNGNSSNPDSSTVTGTGSYLNHARNLLTATVFGFEHRGTLTQDHHQLQWGLKYQHEGISDRVNEWEMRDSAGYSIPYHYDAVTLYQAVTGNNIVGTNRFSGFLQDTWSANMEKGTLIITGGVRFQNWDYNHQTIISPRISGSWKTGIKRDRIFKASWGVYDQMPFYKELKNNKARIVKEVKAQKSVHYVIGYDQIINKFERPVRISAEIWYKALSHLIPYQIDNLNIQYLPEQESVGYATGVDFKINGELASGAQSWASLSLMKTEEDITGDYYFNESIGSGTEKIYPGYIARPTDQRINCSIFLQDYFPGYPSAKLNMTLFYGSRLPFGPPNSKRYMDTFRMPPYQRVDVGFSKSLTDKSTRFSLQSKKHKITDASIGFEIYNLFDINNTISYVWISDIKNQMHAVPNYLTGRRINLKLSVQF